MLDHLSIIMHSYGGISFPVMLVRIITCQDPLSCDTTFACTPNFPWSSCVYSSELSSRLPRSHDSSCFVKKIPRPMYKPNIPIPLQLRGLVLPCGRGIQTSTKYKNECRRCYSLRTMQLGLKAPAAYLAVCFPRKARTSALSPTLVQVRI
jgi:hypothetical protein